MPSWSKEGNISNMRKLAQMSPDASQLKWKAWASRLLIFRQQSHVVGLRKVLTFKESKEYVQTQQRNTLSQKKTQGSLGCRLATYAQFENLHLFKVQWELLAFVSCEDTPHLQLTILLKVRARSKGWGWILGSDRRPLLGAETPNSSMKSKIPAGSFQFHHPPVFA